MLGIGFWEMLVIAVLILVAVGPDRLPAMIKQVAKFYRQFRRTAEDLRASTGIDDLLRDEELRELADFRKQKLAALLAPKPVVKPPIATPEGIPATAVSPAPTTSIATPVATAVEPVAPPVASAPGANTQSITTNAMDPGHAMLGATLPAARGRVLPPSKGLNAKERDVEMPPLGVDVVEARLRDVAMSEEEMQARQARIEAKLAGQPLDVLAAVKANAGVLE